VFFICILQIFLPENKVFRIISGLRGKKKGGKNLEGDGIFPTFAAVFPGIRRKRRRKSSGAGKKGLPLRPAGKRREDKKKEKKRSLRMMDTRHGGKDGREEVPCGIGEGN